MTLVGFHGYGEDGLVMMEALQRIRGSEPWSLASIQALHPFYRISTGKVVAGWMTLLDRETAIRDNVDYVKNALEMITADLGAEPLAAVGFSQGAAMAWRTVEGAGVVWRALVINGGDIPPEIIERDWSFVPPTLILRGQEDELYSEAKLEEDLAVGAAKGHALDSTLFRGGHEWADVACERARGFLIAALS